MKQNPPPLPHTLLEMNRVLERAEQKAFTTFEAFQKATSVPDYQERLEALEERYVTARTLRLLWKQSNGFK